METLITIFVVLAVTTLLFAIGYGIYTYFNKPKKVMEDANYTTIEPPPVQKDFMAQEFDPSKWKFDASTGKFSAIEDEVHVQEEPKLSDNPVAMFSETLKLKEMFLEHNPDQKTSMEDTFKVLFDLIYTTKKA